MKGFREDVQGKDALEIVERTKFLTDLKSLALQIREKGHILIGVLMVDKFVRIARKIARNFRVVDKQEITRQYKIFLQRLASATAGITEKKLKMLDSKDLIQKFLASGDELYVGCEMAIEASCRRNQDDRRIHCRIGYLTLQSISITVKLEILGNTNT